MALPDQGHFSLNTVFKGLRKKVCEACPFMRYDYAIIPKMFFICLIPNQNFIIFTKREKYYPHIPIG